MNPLNSEDFIDLEYDGEICLVCGKSLRPGEALAKIHQDDTKLPICCPLCLDAYQNDRATYLERHAKRTLLRELRQAAHPQSESGET